MRFIGDEISNFSLSKVPLGRLGGFCTEAKFIRQAHAHAHAQYVQVLLTIRAIDDLEDISIPVSHRLSAHCSEQVSLMVEQPPHGLKGLRLVFVVLFHRLELTGAFGLDRSLQSETALR